MSTEESIILLADIGNTSIKLGFANEKKILHSFVLPTRSQYSSDSLGLLLRQMISTANLENIKFAALCSVVPELTTTFQSAVNRYLFVQTFTFPYDFEISMKNCYENPHEVGADRLMAAYAARTLYPDFAGIISVDYGTATTFDCIAYDNYLGGLICPGLLSSHNALAQGTAKLPHINLNIHSDDKRNFDNDETSIPIIGKNTVTSMSNGFIFGFVAMTDGLCEKLKEQLPKPLCVIATGGFAYNMQSFSSNIEHVHAELILDGLRLASAPLLR